MTAETFDTLITLVNTHGFWVLGIATIGMALRWHWRNIGHSLSDPADLGFLNYQARLREDTWVNAYHRLLQNWLLTPLDRRLRDGDQQTCHPGGHCDRLFGIQPWTAKSYEFCLRLALIYPLAMVFCLWSFGFSGRLGDFVLLPATTPSIRFGVLVWLSVIFYALYRSVKSTGWKEQSWLAITLGCLFAGQYVFDSIIGAITIAAAVVLAGAARAVVFAGAGVARAVVPSVTVVATAGIGIGVSVSISVVASTSLFAVGLLFGLLLARHTYHEAQLTIWLGYTTLMLSIIFSLLLLPRIFTEFTLSPLFMNWLVFLGLLPLLNTLWDWCSLGLTRGLLAGIVRHKHPGLWACGWAFLDMVLALVFLFGIVLTITAALAGTNATLITGGGEAWFDLPGLLAGVRAAPDDPQYYWLYAMFVSTLLPTLLHALVAAASVIQIVNVPWLRDWRLRAADQLPNHRARQAQAQVYFFFIPLLALIAPCALLYGLYRLLLAHGGALGWWLLDSAEAIALFILPATT
jgi:hypothetical protein